MMMDKDLMMRKSMAQTVQDVFFSARVEDYFEVLAEMTGDSSYRLIVKDVLAYSQTDEDYLYGFDSPSHTVNPDITVGEMMYVIANMLSDHSYDKQKLSHTQKELVRKTGISLMEKLFVEPLLRMQAMTSAEPIEKQSAPDTVQVGFW